MRKVILYVAMSLDGYLADQNGGVDWLLGENPEQISPWYEEFYHSVDTILMGNRTFQQINTELSPEFWIYGDKQSYVFCHSPQEDLPNITFYQRSPSQLVHWLKHRKGKDIWLCGGKDLIAQMMADDLVDQLHISIIPTLLGSGMPLFPQSDQETTLKLLSQRTENGIVDLRYEKR